MSELVVEKVKSDVANVKSEANVTSEANVKNEANVKSEANVKIEEFNFDEIFDDATVRLYEQYVDVKVILGIGY